MNTTKLILAAWAVAAVVVGVLAWKLATISKPRLESPAADLANNGQPAATGVAGKVQSAAAITVQPCFLGKGVERPPARAATLNEVFTNKDLIGVGNILIAVPGIVRDHRTVVTAAGRRTLPYDDLRVFVAIAIKQRARVHVVSWSSPESPARLTDESGRSFPQLPDTKVGLLTLQNAERPPARLEASVDLTADPKYMVAADGITFERPVLMPDWFILELPCSNFGGEGSIRFRLAPIQSVPQLADVADELAPATAVTATPAESSASKEDSIAVIFIVCLVLAVSGVYLLPTVVAGRRNHPNAAPIAVVNVFLGWTFVGWVVALAWALMATGRERLPTRR